MDSRQVSRGEARERRRPAPCPARARALSRVSEPGQGSAWRLKPIEVPVPGAGAGTLLSRPCLHPTLQHRHAGGRCCSGKEIPKEEAEEEDEGRKLPEGLQRSRPTSWMKGRDRSEYCKEGQRSFPAPGRKESLG